MSKPAPVTAAKPKSLQGQVISSYSTTVPDNEQREKLNLIKDTPQQPTTTWSAINKADRTSKFDIKPEVQPDAAEVAPAIAPKPTVSAKLTEADKKQIAAQRPNVARPSLSSAQAMTTPVATSASAAP